MELIKEAINKVLQINNEFLVLYGLLKDLNLTAYENEDIWGYIVNIDMALGKLEMKLEEIDKERESE